MSAIPITKVVATIIRFTVSPKSTRFSTQIFAPSTPIMPNSAVPAPPRTPSGTDDSTAPSFGDIDKTIAPIPATAYAAVE